MYSYYAALVSRISQQFRVSAILLLLIVEKIKYDVVVVYSFVRISELVHNLKKEVQRLLLDHISQSFFPPLKREVSYYKSISSF
jgi:hypothetical protein